MKKGGFVSWLFGYYRLTIPYSSSAEFMNLCMRYGFVYYAFKTDREAGTAEFICSFHTSKKLMSACKFHNITIEIKSAHGLPKLLYKYRARSGIFVGIILSVMLLCLSQSVLWQINVKGNERLTEKEVIEALEECGLKIGGKLSSFDIDSIENRVLLNSDDISWLSVNMSGTVANVEIREVIDTEIKEKNTRPANLVAKCDAQVVSIEVYSGFLCVEAGDFVRAGDLLVSGLYDSTQSAYRYTRASGRIFAKTTHTFTVEIPLKKEIKVYSDGYSEKKTLNFFGNSIKLFANSGNVGASCDIINYEYSLNPFGLGNLPISVSVEKNYPYTYEMTDIDEALAQELAYYELRAILETELPDAQLLKKSLYGELTEDSYVLKCTVVCIEDIAKISEFDIK